MFLLFHTLKTLFFKRMYWGLGIHTNLMSYKLMIAYINYFTKIKYVIASQPFSLPPIIVYVLQSLRLLISPGLISNFVLCNSKYYQWIINHFKKLNSDTLESNVFLFKITNDLPCVWMLDKWFNYNVVP